MIRPTPLPTRPDPLVPYSALFRAAVAVARRLCPAREADCGANGVALRPEHVEAGALAHDPAVATLGPLEHHRAGRVDDAAADFRARQPQAVAGTVGSTFDRGGGAGGGEGAQTEKTERTGHKVTLLAAIWRPGHPAARKRMG